MKTAAPRVQIGLIVPALELGGGVPAVARFVLDVARRHGFGVKLVSLSMDSRDPQSTRLGRPRSWYRDATVRIGTWQGVTLQHVGAQWGDLEFQRYKPRRVLTEVVADCDLLQVVSGSPAWANTVIGLGIPVSLQVATRTKVERRARDARPLNASAWWRKAMTVITDGMDDRALRSADAIQLENPWMLEYTHLINKGRTNVDVRYAPPGVNTQLFYPLSERPFAATPSYVLSVGRLDDPRKNVSLLLDAFKELSSRLLHVQLVTAGAGRPPPIYWAQVEAMGLRERVHHIEGPATVDLIKLYQHATVFVLSSDEEGLGVVILEAMACGVPVVATRCGGPDGIITDGKDGYLVPLDDAAAMAQRLELLFTDVYLNQELGREARKTIEARYADDVAGAAFVNVWEKLLQRAGTL